jgi:protein-disulfide isomerase
MQKKEVLPVIPSKDFFLGNREAPVRLTMFGDYESADTRKLNEIIMQVLKTFEGKVSFSYRHFPLTQIHQRAHKAAEAVIAAGQEGRYWEMHQLVMEHPHSLGIISLKSLAREAGVVNKRFLDQLMNGTFGWNVQDDLREGLSLGIREVPVLLINGSIIEKPLVAGHVNKAIRQLLTKSPRANGRVAA